MTNVQNGFDSQLPHDVPQDLQPEPTRARKTLLLLCLLAITGAAWWTIQDRSHAVDAAPSLASTATLPVPIDESPMAPAPARDAKPAVKAPVTSRSRDASLIARSQVLPKYPASALRSGETGTVLVLANIDRNGVPIEVSLDDRSGNREFDRSALQAVRQWRFQPALRDGKPVASTVRVPVEFALERG
ncbi:energy transducer TonB [Thermomonas carbonis]|uniref:Energy transducer TonB n=1 Tax=Thermomonas carbonis TaxID=1463158 RepID=A0A7G9SN85_9GAMM|nr:energy transducer TonB [Thermomonas carbonis]QNN69310.1 energy transducer TonB [Thermomonas carbonis]